MNKELQDRAWAALPKEFRDEIKEFYTIEVRTDIGKGFRNALETFGRHNLTSDTEPEEMLCVKRSEIMDLYSKIDKHIGNNPENEIPMLGVQSYLLGIFGDKCTPDKDTPNLSNPSNIGKNEPQPKFKIDDVVRVIDTGEIAAVNDYSYMGYRLDFDDAAGDIWYKEEEIEAYDATKNNPLLAEFKGLADGLSSLQDKLRTVYSRLAKKAVLMDKYSNEKTA